MKSERRNPRRAAAKVTNGLDEANNDSSSESSSSSSNSSGETETTDDEVLDIGRSMKKSVPVAKSRRTSSRATKFQKNMKEPNGESIRDLLNGQSQYISDKPARNKASVKKNVTVVIESDDDDDGEDDDSVEKSRRTSSRATKFQKSMKEPNGESIRDLFQGESPFIKDKPARSKGAASKKKSPAVMESDDDDDDDSSSHHEHTKLKKSRAVRHSSQRRRVKTEVPVSESDSEEESEEDEQDSLKIQRILASRSEKRSRWREIGKQMNTSEIDYGSRWFQEDDDKDKLDSFEERFLVKWADLSYMHCSWEAQEDLIEQVDSAKTYFTSFFRKSENGLLFTADERCDGDYFDPAFVQIDRILEVHIPDGLPKADGKRGNESLISRYGIVMDKSDLNFESGTGRQFLIKWSNTPYSECTYEFERDLILNDVEYVDKVKAFQERSTKPSKIEMKKNLRLAEEEKRRSYLVFGDKSKMSDEQREAKVKEYQQELENQESINGGKLRDYQAEGVTWLMSNLINGRSSILADEMGLGKTIQTAAFVNLVATRLKRRGPFLIVAPLSTLLHWQREFTGWTKLNTIIYHGTAKDRELLREFEMAYECDRPTNGVAFNQSYLRKCMAKTKTKAERLWLATVVITTPEMLVTPDFMELTAIRWEMLVVDEAHRLKNNTSKLTTNLRDPRFEFAHTLLLTGTPIQNNMSELWTLMNIIDPVKYGAMEDFLKDYGDIKSKEKIDELHEGLRPYILRRLKEDVEKSVPPKEETLIEVELTTLQKQYYRALYEKNVQFLHRNKKKALDGPSINNLAMQLRKCCNHPFLLRGVEIEVREQEAKADKKLSEGDFLVNASGKLVLLDKLLPRLKENGHKVLIFSQFKIMLDILEDYLATRQMKSERIDGSITGNKRQMAIDRFQTPGVGGKESPFVMLLSTRAGGVGINLTAADTCIIFDSDWNPQNDLQAQARCHRIGQTKSVKVYRLLSRKTYEMQMFHMSSLKMGLDQAVLHGFENGGSSGEGAMTKEEVEKLLRRGAYDIFNEQKNGSAEAESNDFIQQDIDTILSRRSRTVVHDNTGSKSNAAGGTFSKASFKAHAAPNSDQSSNNNEDVDIDDPEFWKKMIGEGQVTGDADDLAGRKRKRSKANYAETEYEKTMEGPLGLSDDGSPDEYEYEEDSDDSSQNKATMAADSFDDSKPSDPTQTKKKSAKRRKQERARWGGAGKGEWGTADVLTLFKALHMYGYGNLPWDTFRDKVPLNRLKFDVDEVKRMCWSIIFDVIREAALEDVENSKRRAARAAEKKRWESVGQSSNPPPQRVGGVLGADLPVLFPVAGHNGGDEQLELAFKKLVNANASWLAPVIADASSFADKFPRRSRDSLDRALHENVASDPSTTKRGISSLFAENVWPSLRSRGWSVETVTDGKYRGFTRYSHAGKQYRSLHAVLDVVPSIYPELSNIVNTIQASASSESEKMEGDVSVSATVSLNPYTMTTKSITEFLRFFGPLQLVVDRATPRKIQFSRKVLTVCSLLHSANAILRRAEDTPGPATLIVKLAKIIAPDKRMPLPHPAWTPRQDAVLIRAIAEHGWIEHDICCRAITEDKKVTWGLPFDDGCEGMPEQPKSIEMTDDYKTCLRETAQRAAAFIGAEHDVLEEVKGFNQDLVVKAYGLVRSTEDGSSSNFVWIVDDSTLFEAACGQPLGTVQGNDHVDLPTKKELVKRARNVLSRSNSAVEPSIDITPEPQTNHGFSVLDKSNPCNTFLLELLRALLKTPGSTKGTRKVKNLYLKLCANAIQEAQYRATAMRAVEGRVELTKPSAQRMQNVVDHIKLFSKSANSNPRGAKNVIRAVLGLAPIASKNTAETLFPVAGRIDLVDVNRASAPMQTSTASDVSIERQAQNLKTTKKLRENGSSCDRAISRAIARATCECKESNAKFSLESSSSSLELAAFEALVLSVAGSQGLPVWTESWQDLVTAKDDALVEEQGPGHHHSITWFGMALVTQTAAEQWYKSALSKLHEKRKFVEGKSGNVQPSQLQPALEQIKILEKDEKLKRRALAQAKDYCEHPVKFAKKVIMLLEALRNRMGPVETKRGGTLKKIQVMNKAEHGLGPLVLAWLGKELLRWAQSLDIVDESGRPVGYIAADFVHQDPTYVDDESVGVGAIFDKKTCRTVFGQIAQLSRARSIFVKNTENDVKFMVNKAVSNVRGLEDTWERQPIWWGNVGDSPSEYNSIHDHDLLEGLLEYGYSGLEYVLQSKPSFCEIKKSTAENGAELRTVVTDDVTKATAQLRANQLTRELHALDGTADMLRIVRDKSRKKSRSLNDNPEANNEEISTIKASSGSGVQKGIQSFFSSTPSPSRCNEKGSPVIIVIDSEDSDVEVVENPNEEVSVKRKAYRTDIMMGSVGKKVKIV